MRHTLVRLHGRRWYLSEGGWAAYRFPLVTSAVSLVLLCALLSPKLYVIAPLFLDKMQL